jgi:Ser/Thr protein kinase RdoA (MazF antagonist)
MSQSRDRLASVLEALAADPTTEFGTPGAEVTIVRRVEGPYSSVYQVRILTPGRTVHAYTKIVKPRRDGADELARLSRVVQREYDATRAFFLASKQDDDVRAVRPIAVVPDHQTLVTEEVPGHPLGDLLTDPEQPAHQLAVIATRVGRWIRAYQGTGGVQGSVELSERRRYLDDRLRLMEGRVVSAAERAATLARFDALAEQIGVPSVPAMPIHADLTPTNIIVDDRGRVAVLDFTMAKTGTTLHDLAHVFFHLELMAQRHRGRRLLFRSLQQAMVRGYDPALTADDALMRLMLMQHGICHVAMLAERRVPLVDVAYRWFLRRRWQVCDQIPGQAAALRVA